MKYILTFLIGMLLFCTEMVTASDEQAHLDAANKLISLIEVEKLMNTVMEQSIKLNIGTAISNEPCLKPYQLIDTEISLEFAKNLIDMSEFKQKMAKLYMEELTVDELNQVIDFYSTPAGKKLLQKLPELSQKGMLLGQELAIKGLEKTKTKEFQEKFQKYKSERYKTIDAKTITPECKKRLEEKNIKR